jgi:hypothetical protein
MMGAARTWWSSKRGVSDTIGSPRASNNNNKVFNYEFSRSMSESAASAQESGGASGGGRILTKEGMTLESIEPLGAASVGQDSEPTASAANDSDSDEFEDEDIPLKR